jgi:hypothetical protein
VSHKKIISVSRSEMLTIFDACPFKEVDTFNELQF